MPSIQSRVFVVDDYKPQQTLTQLPLKSTGHSSVLAEHGHSAIEILEGNNEFDVMICDMIMEEGFDGLDTIRRALQIKPDLPCIIATGFSENDRVSAALELDACACLNKSYTGKLLAKAVKRALPSDLSFVTSHQASHLNKSSRSGTSSLVCSSVRDYIRILQIGPRQVAACGYES